MTHEPLTLSAEEIAAHLRWKLSNSNSELDLGNGTVLDVAFNAWSDGDDGRLPGFNLSVSAYDGDTGLAVEQEFRVTLTAI